MMAGWEEYSCLLISLLAFLVMPALIGIISISPSVRCSRSKKVALCVPLFGIAVLLHVLHHAVLCVHVGTTIVLHEADIKGMCQEAPNLPPGWNMSTFEEDGSSFSKRHWDTPNASFMFLPMRAALGDSNYSWSTPTAMGKLVSRGRRVKKWAFYGATLLSKKTIAYIQDSYNKAQKPSPSMPTHPEEEDMHTAKQSKFAEEHHKGVVEDIGSLSCMWRSRVRSAGGGSKTGGTSFIYVLPLGGTTCGIREGYLTV